MTVRQAVLLAALVAGHAAWSSAGPPSLTITKPPAGVPAHGVVTVVVEVAADEAVTAVEIIVDGRRAARLTRPPYRADVDLGPDNIEHRFRAVAATASGDTVSASLETPKLQVDEEMSYKLEQLYVTAMDLDQRVLGLGRDDFKVADEGAPQRIITFEGGDAPFTAALLLDASASMAGAKLRAALSGAQAFAGTMRPLDEAKLVVFSDSLIAASPFVGGGEQLLEGAAGIEARGGSAINDHLFEALSALEQRQGRRVVVLLSDGLDSHSALTIDDVLPLAGRSRALIYWVRLVGAGSGSPDRDPSREHSAWRDGRAHLRQVKELERAVERSGGRVVMVSTVEAILPAFAGILAELRDQYVLGYYPTTSRHDGSWHDVKVSIRRAFVKARTSAGYYDF